MTIEELQAKYDRLYQKVKKCRGWQREYKKYHIESDRQVMIRHERELDSMIAVEDKVQKSLQKEMF